MKNKNVKTKQNMNIEIDKNIELISPKKDGFDIYRKEMNAVLIRKLSQKIRNN